MQNFWPWLVLGLLPHDLSWKRAHGRRTLAVHAVYWSLVLSWRHTKKGQRKRCAWMIRLFLLRLQG